MFELFKAILLGAVQGITEFLPISSTGHLILFEKLLGISQDTYGLAFDAALHMGTLVAVLWFFRTDWVRLLTSLATIAKNKTIKTANERLIIFLILGTIPAMILGLLLEDLVDSLFRSPFLVGCMLILFSGILYYFEKVAERKKEITQLSNADIVVVGTAQAIALIPGVSRSGITMAAGMFRGLKRAEAARFAFLLSAPIVAGAGGKKLVDTMEFFSSGKLTYTELAFFVTGMVSAAIFGYLTIKYFMAYISKYSLYPFIAYRILLGVFIILATFVF